MHGAPHTGKSTLVMKLRALGLLALLAIVAPARSFAESVATDSTRLSSPAPVVFQGDTVVVLRATVAGTPPPRRAEAAVARLERLNLSRLLQPLRIEPVEQGYLLLIGDEFIVGIANGDVDS